MINWSIIQLGIRPILLVVYLLPRVQIASRVHFFALQHIFKRTLSLSLDLDLLDMFLANSEPSCIPDRTIIRNAKACFRSETFTKVICYREKTI